MPRDYPNLSKSERLSGPVLTISQGIDGSRVVQVVGDVIVHRPRYIRSALRRYGGLTIDDDPWYSRSVEGVVRRLVGR